MALVSGAVLLALLLLADRFVGPLIAPEWQMIVVLAGSGAVFLGGALAFIVAHALIRRRE